MKLLVVDDENLIVRGIAHVIEQFHGPFTQVDMACSGEDALEQMELVHYDLLITDISMPGMSGLELIETAQAKGVCENFCILSGYSEFEYARTAIHLGVEEYLLKPVDKEKLRELLEAVSRKSHSQNSARRQERENLLTDCLFGRADSHELHRQEPLLLVVAESLFQTAGPILRRGLEKYRDNGLVDDILSTHDFPVLVLLGRSGMEDRLVNELLKDFHGIFIGTASGLPAKGSELRELYERALHAALSAHCFLGRHYLRGDGLSVPRSSSQEDLQRLLAEQLDVGATEGQLLFYQLCWRSLTTKPPVSKSVAVSNPYVAQMVGLVERRFAEELTLNHVAKTISLNPEYASKLFRTETGMSFSEYLNRYRIARILEFMTHDPSLSFEQLAPCMGFPDLRNFYRVFKRIMKTTPGKYRELLCPLSLGKTHEKMDTIQIGGNEVKS